MKIVSVAAHLLDCALDRPFESASGRFGRRQHCLVEVVCADGTVGWGECLGPAVPNAAVVAAYAPLLVGRDPLENEVLWQQLYNALRDQGQRGLSVTALSGIDIALWDIKGKHFGVSVSRLLGGRFRETVQAYATGGFYSGRPDRPGEIAEEVSGYAAEGFRAAKIKIGLDPEEDLAVIRALRAAVGDDFLLMIDANHGYDVLEAIQVGRAAADHAIGWFEEPVLPEQLEAYRRVREGQPLPVAAGETWHARFAMHQALEAGAVDILQPDVCGSGGFTEMRRIVDLAALYGVRVNPHVWGTAVQIAASLQVLAALPPDPPRRNPVAPLLEFDRTPNPFRQAIVTEPLEQTGGILAIPDRPGLGIEIDRAVLARFKP